MTLGQVKLILANKQLTLIPASVSNRNVLSFSVETMVFALVSVCNDDLCHREAQ